MRPVLLRVEGFTCFKREQLVDFNGLDLFAISGQTGAGKSSILDAMVYALYGRIPRIGKRGYTEFISLGASRMSVRFDFTVGERRYRVTRTARRAGTATAQIEELTADGETLRASLADGVANVDRAVVEIVGLEYEGFIQAVVLPQGDFAKFLKSPAGDRTKLLRELLRLGRYEDMRQLAQTKSKEAAGEAAHIEKRLAEDYGGATPAEVGRLEGRVTEDDRALGVLRKKLQASELEVKHAGRLRERTAELEAKEREKRGLSGKEEAISRTREQIEAASRAVKVAPLLRKVHDEETREVRAKGELADAEEALRSAVGHEKKTQARDVIAKNAAKRIPALENTIQQLGEVIGLLEPKKRAEQGVRRLEEEERQTRQRVDALAKQRQSAVGAVESADKSTSAAERELERVEYEPKFHQKVEDVLEDATALGTMRKAAHESQASASEAEQAASNAKKDAESATNRVEVSARTLDRAVRDAEQAATRLSDAERAHAADHLRNQLRPGEQCPVCEQRVSSIPKARKASQQLDKFRITAEEARNIAKVSQDNHAELQSESRSLARAAVTASKNSEKAIELSARSTAACEKAGKRLEAWAVRAELKFTGHIEEYMHRLDRELRVKRRKHDEAQEAVRAARKRKDEACQLLEKFDSQISGAHDKLESLTEQVAEVKDEVKDYLKKIALVSGDDDPREARNALQAERTDLEDSEEEARHAAGEASKAVAVCQSRVTSATGQLTTTTAELQAARDQANQGVRTAGFTNPAAAHAALLSEETILQLDREVREFVSRLSTLGDRIADLKQELGGHYISQQELDQKETERNALTDQVEATASALRVAEARLQELRERLVKAQELASQLESRQQTARVFGILADELQSNRFQQYLHDEIVQELVAGASERLKKISDRYALVLREGEFWVLDHDNAGEQRSADTLSGGETFLTSLALALELSTRVQDAAGAVRLESIFIDEGFGTLDPDTLETVAGAIESLPVGGRMVGIITHIAELTERMPGRIAIDRGTEGSRIQVHKQ